MQLYVRMFVAVATFFALVLGSLGVLTWRRRQAIPGRGRWTIANLLFALCLLLFALRGVVPDWISIVSANAVVIGAAILSLEGIREFRGLRPRVRVVYAGGVITILAVVYFDYIVNSMNARISAVSLYLGLVGILCSVTLLRRIPAECRLLMTFNGIMFALSAAIQIARAIYFHFALPITDLFAPSWTNALFALGAALSIACCSVGWVVLSDERLARDLEDAESRTARVSEELAEASEHRRVELEARRNLEEIAHFNRVAAMGELTASLAHEINQPLAAILSNAQAATRFLSAPSPDLAAVRECLIDIVADDKRAGEIIRRLRALVKKGEFQATVVDLNDVVRDVIHLVGNDALLRQSSVSFEPASSLPPVLGDRVQLYQVVLNLVMNGLDAASERPPGDRWLLVRTAESGGGVIELTVKDSGKGIAESDLARVFEPFFSTKPEGLGMGLSISWSIVQQHGGRIWAENSPAGGAVFRCVLPVAQQAATVPG